MRFDHNSSDVGNNRAHNRYDDRLICAILARAVIGTRVLACLSFPFADYES
jgi:hypothetical protein